MKIRPILTGKNTNSGIFVKISEERQKNNIFAKLNVKDVADDKLFWKNIKPYFSDKGSNSTKITLVGKDIIITDEKQIASIKNEDFVSITKKFCLKPSIYFLARL